MLAPFISIAILFSDPVGPSPEGSWQNPTASVIIVIAPCGEAFCGSVSWASDKAQADARKGGTDRLVGTQVLSNFVSTQSGSWKGQLFLPDLNKRSKAEIRRIGDSQLKVTGCAIAGLVCKSQLWTRVEVE